MDELPVLLVEDDQSLAMMARTFLEERYNASVTVAGTCSRARQLIKTNAFDLIILDYRLPDGSGLELLQEMVSVGDHPTVTLMTGQGDERTAVAAFRLGADGYVIKGADMVAMLSEVVDKAAVMAALRRNSMKLEQVEESLRATELMYRSVVETSPSGITVTGLDGKILMCSPSTLRLHGYEKEEEIIGRSAFDLIAPGDRERAAKNLVKTLGEEAIHNVEYTLLRRDGSSFFGLLSSAVVKDSEGNPETFIAVTQNISERKEAEKEVQQLTRLLIKEHEGARLRLAADLHDEICQSLNVLKVNLSRIQKDLHGSDIIEEMKSMLDSALDAARGICYELRPPELDYLGLETALRNYVSGFSEKTGTITDLKCIGMPDIPEEIGIGLFRVVQEALTNVQKHAEASKVNVSLTTEGGSLSLIIMDDGQGFDTAERKGQSFGLLEMRERIAMLGGKLQVDSTIGEGTMIRVSIPI
jgi:two-component system sensor histidine kinase UhpB